MQFNISGHLQRLQDSSHDSRHNSQLLCFASETYAAVPCSAITIGEAQKAYKS